MNQADTKVMTAHVPVHLADDIDRYAAQQDRSRAWVIKQALTAWVEQEKERTRLTREGLESVTAGRVVSHADVLTWSQSLGSGKPRPRPVSRR